MKKVFPALAIVALAVTLTACGDDDDEADTSTPTQTGIGESVDPSATERPPQLTETVTPEPTPPPNVCAPNPNPASPDVVQVDAPAAFTRVTSPVTVSGRIAAFEATFKIRVFDAQGGIAGGITAMSAEGQTLSAFSADVEYGIIAEKPGCIWVYEDSPMDGNPINVVQIPVVLLAN
jgi:hypothetical protein